MEADCSGLGPSSTHGPGEQDHDQPGTEKKELLERTTSVTNGQSSSGESSSSNHQLSSGEKLRRKRKLHRCLNDLKHFLISTNREASTDRSESDRLASKTSGNKRMTGVDAVRRALKLLKRQEELVLQRDTDEERVEGTCMWTMDGLNRDATDIFQCASSRGRHWSSESRVATTADKCDDIVLEHENSIHFLVSCQDGTVVEASENAFSLLQFSPSVPMTGQHFVNLFSPDDQPLLVAYMLKANLTSASNQSVKSEHEDSSSVGQSELKIGFYASARRGSLASTKKDEGNYVHCRLVCRVAKGETKCENGDGSVLVSVTALPLTVLIGPEYPEPSTLIAFYTKHTPSCIFTHVDSECVKSWGYLPRELIGRSLLSYVSKESLKWLEAAHEQAVKAKGKPVRSKLFYFLLRDGKVATMRTEWSLFVNPWSRETEFVIGYHKVVDRSENARFYCEEDPHVSSIVSIKLEGRAAKAQSRIRRALAKVKDQRYYKSQTITKKPVTACSSTTDKENGSTVGSGTTQNGSSSGGQGSNLQSTPTYPGSKSKRILNMGAFLDRMIESELFRNVDLRRDTDLLGGALDCKVVMHAETDHVMENRVIHHQTSPISTGENISSSPPESNGSGPTYKEINLKEKVARFLNSQAAGQSSSSPPDGSNSCKSQLSGYSPPSYHHPDTQPDHVTPHVATGTESGDKPMGPPDPNMGAIDLSTVVAASIMHRSQSAAADLTQYRHLTAALEGDAWNVPLTPEILRQFTKEKERESKADWKRRFSTADAPPGLGQGPQQRSADKSMRLQQPSDQISPSPKRAPFDQPLELSSEAPPQKILRPAAEQFFFQRENRPSSMPVISRMANIVESASKNPTGLTPWTCPPPARNTTDYYRSLGPTPAPPPGKNFQISSAPLPVPAAPSTDPFVAGAVEKNAFSYLNQSPSSYVHPHQSAFAPPHPKPAFGSGAPPPDGHRSVIQASPSSPFAPPAPPPPLSQHWLNMPGTSASAILQRMVPKALAREQAEAGASNFWPPAPPPSSSDQAPNDYGRYNHPAPTTRPYFEYSSIQQGSVSMTNYQLENMYSEFGPGSDRVQQKANDEV